jgi:Skp family chaperone for outer membrane proteins
MPDRTARLLEAALLLAMAASLPAQVDLKDSAVVYFGSAANTSAPGTIDETKVREATSEWQTIKAESVRPGSARYLLLVAEMDKRIREAVKSVAGETGKDLVVRANDIEDQRGREVVDITDKVVGKLTP